MKFLACDSTASPRAYQSKKRLRSVGRSLQCWALTSCMWLTHRRAMAISALHLTALSSSSTFAGVQERGRMFAACIRLAPVFLTRTCDPCMLSSCAHCWNLRRVFYHEILCKVSIPRTEHFGFVEQRSRQPGRYRETAGWGSSAACIATLQYCTVQYLQYLTSFALSTSYPSRTAQAKCEEATLPLFILSANSWPFNPPARDLHSKPSTTSVSRY